jgi:crotonobetainyl-CoA:carnitine CoA-transferase CaiB-like acyl-CoA transferase
LCQGIDAPQLASDERFATNALRSQHRQVLRPLLEQALAAHEGKALAVRLLEAGVPCAPIQDIAAALKDAHTAHRGMVVQIGEHYRGIGSPIKLERTPPSYRLAPPKRGS